MYMCLRISAFFSLETWGAMATSNPVKKSQFQMKPYQKNGQIRVADDEIDRMYYQHSFEKMQITLGISPAGALKRIKMGLDSPTPRIRSMRMSHNSAHEFDYLPLRGSETSTAISRNQYGQLHY